MARPPGQHNGYGYPPPASSPSPYEPSSSNRQQYPASSAFGGDHNTSPCDDISAGCAAFASRILAYLKGPGLQAAMNLAARAGHQLRRNAVRRRLLSFPHLLVALWVILMLWGERWVFAGKVRDCDWHHWEHWPPGAVPHRLVFVADPQLIDPHSYPGRPWPINPLTMRITDNYMTRAYTQLQRILRPDSVMFLGDLFDGGREWKTAHGNFADPEWAKGHRPADEQKYVKQWNKKYGEQYWLHEYKRFGNIFFDNWLLGGDAPGPGQRGRKLVTSLPGNHDLGFGAEVKIPVRERFIAYFGDTNRVDVIGNHTFVSVDTVSLSAETSQARDMAEVHEIYEPVNEFLTNVKAEKRRAVEKELRFWRGEFEELQYAQKVEELDKADFKNLPTLDRGSGSADFPTVLLSHVPLYRPPGTPCGPMREHWPPAKPPKGQTTPVFPDHRNAISVSGGYQYQNVLNEADTMKLINSIGNIKHAFSGDDHDYCELVHSPNQENIHEVTVKSLSMAMGVPTPGFQMISMWNPVDAKGKPLGGGGPEIPTLQTHLCLLPTQLSTFMLYAILGVLSVIILAARSFLVPMLNLQPFALDPKAPGPQSAVLPVFKAKSEGADDNHGYATNSTASASSSASKALAGRTSRTRGASLSAAPGSGIGGGTGSSHVRSSSPKKKQNARWGWGSGGGRSGPRIQIRRDADAYANNGNGSLSTGGWRPAVRGTGRQRWQLGQVWREFWTTTWRVVWMVLLFFAYLTWKG
ncbi:cell division control protein [Microdochium bolleyi]|uniref:Cell division control protein n=1 Tax=Microdochium bolleyi TaxID=196109 RepID=A0A136J2S6_9PEZI|nr:cell division control protein [Microdochium bolleyi]